MADMRRIAAIRNADNEGHCWVMGVSSPEGKTVDLPDAQNSTWMVLCAL